MDVGTFDDSLNCKECKLGRHLLDEAATVDEHDDVQDCLSCPEKGMQHTSTTTVCEICSAGKYQDQPVEDLAVCKDCPLGRVVKRQLVRTGSVSSSVVGTAQYALVTHEAVTPPLVVGDVVTVSGHTGSANDLAMNQVYTVHTVPYPTKTMLEGNGLPSGTYNTGTIVFTTVETVAAARDEATDCLQCLAGKKFVSASEDCAMCAVGQYQDQNDMDSAACVECPEGRYMTSTFAATRNKATSTTSAVITYLPLSSPLAVGDVITMSGHEGDAANLAMNQEFIVSSVSMQLDVLMVQATSSTSATLHYANGDRALISGDTVAISGFTYVYMNSSPLLLNQIFTVASDSEDFVAMTLSVSQSEVILGGSRCIITHAVGTRPVKVGERLVLSGHTGNQHSFAMNQEFVVQEVLTTTTAQLARASATLKSA
jgi:hypothetical protein